MTSKTEQRSHDKSRNDIIKIGQLNLQNSNRAERDLDFLLIQEPYSINGTVKGFGLSTSNTVLGKQDLENRPMAGIVCKSSKEPLHLLQHCTKHFTVCKIKIPTGYLNLVSGYFQCAERIDPFLQHLLSILNDLQGEEVLISIDSNAHSQLWFWEEEDQKGSDMADFIEQNNLIILNRRHQPQTHKPGTNIDLTLSTGNISRLVRSWTVHPNDTISDHNLVLLELEFNKASMQRKIEKHNIRRANFEEINHSIAGKVLNLNDLPTETSNDLENLARAYQNAIETACKENLPQIKIKR